jgi:uncharacterized protein YggT (Ycf19 family)
MQDGRETRYERVERRDDPVEGRSEVVSEERYVDGAPVRPLATAPVDPVVVEPYNYRAVQITWFVVAVITTLIAIRFVLKMLGASPQSEFVGFMYGVTAPLVAPFRGIFADTATGFNVFEASSLVAIVIYLLVGWGIVALIRLVTQPRRRRIAP